MVKNNLNVCRKGSRAIWPLPPPTHTAILSEVIIPPHPRILKSWQVCENVCYFEIPVSVFSGRDMSRNVCKSSLRKFYGRYGDLTKQYEAPLSRMLHDILDDDHIQWNPPLIGHYTNFWPLLIWTLLPNLTFYLIVQGFHRTYATGAACQQRTLTPPDTWSCPTLGLACVLMSRPISPELVLSPDFWISNTLGTSLLLQTLSLFTQTSAKLL